MQAIGLGATYARACAAAGIHFDTFNEWRKSDPEFSAAIEKASGERVVRALKRIETSARKGNWQADAWLLERLYPDEYGRTIQRHEGEVSHKLQIEYTNNWRGRHHEEGEATA